MEIDEICCSICCQEYCDTITPMVLPCGHTFCNGCLQKTFNINKRCPKCQRNDGFTNSVPKNYALIEIVKSREIFLEDKKKTMITCSKCKCKSDERETHICKTCLGETHDYKNFSKFILDLDIKSLALCAKCSLRYHVFLEHTVEPFFNLARHVNLEEISSEISETQKSIDRLNENTKELFSEFQIYSKSSSEVIKDTSCFLNDCFSTEEQNEMKEALLNKLENVMTIFVDIENNMKVFNSKYKGVLDELNSLKKETSKKESSNDEDKSVVFH